MKHWNNDSNRKKSVAGRDGQDVETKSHSVSNHRGIFTIITGFAVVGLMAFTALGIETGRWYVVRAELSKSVDAAALVGAKNISNPYLNTEDLMEEIGQANFSPGLFGTQGAAQITGTVEEGIGRVSVVGSVSVLNKITRVVEMQAGVPEGHFDTTLVASTGAAQQRDVEIMMVLDRSGSMSSAMNDLKDAAKSFIDFFELTQENDQFGLISFASGVVIDFPLGVNFVDDMKTAIDNMSASGGTNTEDSIDQANDVDGFSDQTGVSGEEKVQQFMIFFSDGNPTAFRGTWTRSGGTPLDAVGYAADWDISLMNPNVPFQYLSEKQYKTGDGLPTSSTVCQSGSPAAGYSNTKWHVLDDPTYGVNGYSEFLNVNYSDLLNTTNPEKCDLSMTYGRSYVEAITKQMAIDHAQELKDQGIKIYTIGLGSVDPLFLAEIASGPGFEFYAPTSTELKSLFQKVATNIKLRLLE